MGGQQAGLEKVDKIFESFAEPGMPGGAVAVSQDGKITCKQGYGLADVELEVPVSPTTVFNTGSESKQFTAFAIALLVEEGKVSLDADIREYLPEMPDFGDVITVRHLIAHTSGLRGSFPELLALAEWRDEDATTTDDVYKLLKAQRALNFKPGNEHLYVNSGYVLLSKIVESASGQSFRAFCKERIFDPLGMDRTVVHDERHMIIPGRARGYYLDNGKVFNAPLTDSVVGPTNVYSTVEDLALWHENFTTGKVGGKAVLDMMHERGKLNNGKTLDYAFGLTLTTYRGLKLVEHGGQQGGYTAHTMRFPELHFSVIVMFNQFMWGTKSYAMQVADAYLNDEYKDRLPAEDQSSEKDIAAQETITLSETQLRRCAGTYYHADRAAIRQVVLHDDKLSLSGLNLLPMDEKTFIFADEPDVKALFAFEGEGAAKTLQIFSSTAYVYERVADFVAELVDLEAYTGRYTSPELEVAWRIELEDDGLVVKRRKYDDSKLTPVFHDCFSDDWLPIMGYPTTYTLLFDRNGEGCITGLTVTGDRVRKLAFKRLSS